MSDDSGFAVTACRDCLPGDPEEILEVTDCGYELLPEFVAGQVAAGFTTADGDDNALPMPVVDVALADAVRASDLFERNWVWSPEHTFQYVWVR